MRFNRTTFFEGFRDRIDSSIEQEQVNGLEFLLGNIEKDPFWTHIPQISYALATIGHETAWSFQPVEEGYYLGDAERVKRFQRTLRYSPYYGRGYVQLTWDYNYKKAGEILKLDLVGKPQIALDPNVAYKVLTYGMHQGWFTGKKLDDFIRNGKKDYVKARTIINGYDKAQLIAGYAKAFERILTDSAAASAQTPLVTPTNSADTDQSVDSVPQPDITEVKTTEVTETGAKTVAVEETVTAPKGDLPGVSPTRVSTNGPLAKWLFSSGTLMAIGTGIWGFVSTNGSIVAVAIICVAALAAMLIFRGAITDAIRMQVAADPDKKQRDMKYVYYALIVVVLMELLAMGIKGQIIGQNNKPWGGGNGCNLIGGKKRLPCCTPHDHAYKEGGGIGRRWDADAKLFKCMWKQGGWNYILAPLMFVGVRAAGMWTFQWGKRRVIAYPIEEKE